MASAYRLYDLIDSPFCLKARICLSLKHVPYERVPLTMARLPELRRVNMLGKVPVLVANGTPVPDSSQIARFLDEKFPQPRLVPRDPSKRAYCHLIEEWADESLYFIIGGFKWLNPANRGLAQEATAEMASAVFPTSLVAYLVRQRVARRYRHAGYTTLSLPHLVERMAENLAHLQDLLGDGPFLMGDFATLADVAVFSQVHWLSRYEERRLLAAVPGVQRWYEQLEAQDAIAQAIRGEVPAAPDALEATG